MNTLSNLKPIKLQLRAHFTLISGDIFSSPRRRLCSSSTSKSISALCATATYWIEIRFACYVHFIVSRFTRPGALVEYTKYNAVKFKTALIYCNLGIMCRGDTMLSVTICELWGDINNNQLLLQLWEIMYV